MIDKVETFGDRFARLKADSGLSFNVLSAAIKERTGHHISGQALHKWTQGGQADEASVIAVCTYFNVHPAWLRYGIGDGPAGTHDDTAKGEVVAALPPEPQQQVLDFIRYKVEGATNWFSAEQIVHYVRMIDGFQKDLEKRKEKDRRAGDDDPNPAARR